MYYRMFHWSVPFCSLVFWQRFERKRDACSIVSELVWALGFLNWNHNEALGRAKIVCCLVDRLADCARVGGVDAAT